MAKKQEQQKKQCRCQTGELFDGFTEQHGAENDYPKHSLLVRKWDDTEWHEPTAAYMGLPEDK